MIAPGWPLSLPEAFPTGEGWRLAGHLAARQGQAWVDPIREGHGRRLTAPRRAVADDPLERSRAQEMRLRLTAWPDASSRQSLDDLASRQRPGFAQHRRQGAHGSGFRIRVKPQLSAAASVRSDEDRSQQSEQPPQAFAGGEVKRASQAPRADDRVLFGKGTLDIPGAQARRAGSDSRGRGRRALGLDPPDFADDPGGSAGAPACRVS